MKKVLALSAFIVLFALLCNTTVQAQASPAQTAKGTIGATDITVAYGSPAVKGRTIWGELVPYDKVWRAGANEATTFESSKDVMIEGQALPAGKYALFAIPGQEEWTIVFNKEARQWGAFKYDETKDALRVKAKPRKAASFNERLTYVVGNSGLMLQWADLEVPVAIK